MASIKPKFMLTLDQDSGNVLGEIAQETGMSVSSIINKLINGQMVDLIGYLKRLKDQRMSHHERMLVRLELRNYDGKSLAGKPKIETKELLIEARE